MKKAILAIAVFLLGIPSLKADVVIEGKAILLPPGENGTISIMCKNAHRDCIRIVSSTAIINYEDGHQETIFNIDGYEIISETEEGTGVVIYGGNY